VSDHLRVAEPAVGDSYTAALMEPWIGVDDLAMVLGVSTDWIYEKAASGDLPSYKFGGHRRFRVSEVESWASNCASGRMEDSGTDEKRRR
jgi:excisionase family DNA binding protein